MRRHRRWSDEEVQYLRKIAPGTPIKEITKKMTKKFSYDFTEKQIIGAMRRYDAGNGLIPQFQKGLIPWNKGKRGSIPWNKGLKTGTTHNRKDVGTEYIDNRGYTYVKVENPSTWKLKHHIVYEKHHGPIEKGYCIIFADKDKTNFNIDNLIKVKNSELMTMNINGLVYENAELTKVGVNVAKLISQTNKRAKK